MSRRKRRKVKPGAAPGTIVVDPNAPKSRIDVFAYGAEEWIEEDDIGDPAKLKGHLERWPVVWVNVDGLGDAQTLNALGEMFGLHRLALEDVVNLGQRAKVEPYDEHVFVVLRMASSRPGGTGEQVSLFLGRNYVLTFQEQSGDCFDPVRERIREGKGRLRTSGPDYLAYALVDALIDGYFPLLDRIGDELESAEREILFSPRKETVGDIQRIKGELRECARDCAPHRDVVRALVREEAFVSESTRLYLRDCEDHALQVSEIAERHREVAVDLMSLYLSSLSNRMNEVMKVLTIVAALFIPLSFVAGVYGMNFDPEASRWNMPELGWAYGYPAALTLMLAVALGMVLYFKRRGWFD